MFYFILGFEAVTHNNMIGGTASSANVPPVNLASLAPPKDDIQLSESARSTLSNRSWITDDKWSDEDDEEEAAAGATGFTPKSDAPVAMLVSGNSSLPPLQQVLFSLCILSSIIFFSFSVRFCAITFVVCLSQSVLLLINKDYHYECM